MKKLLIATAALAMVAGTAQAQSSVTIYGAYGNGFVSTETNNAKAVNTMGGDRFITPVLGFQGTEDLGGGNKAFFNLQGSLGANGSLGFASSSTTGNNVFDRLAHAGVSTKFGTLSLGRQNDSIKDIEGLSALTNMIDATNSTEVGDRYANLTKYVSPSIQGLTLSYTYSDAAVGASASDAAAAAGNPTQSAALDGTAIRSYNAQYTFQGVKLAYAAGETSAPSVAGAAGVEKSTQRFSAQGVVMGATLGVSLTKNELNTAGTDTRDNLLFSVKSPTINGFSVYASYADDDSTTGTTDGKAYTLMLTKDFSKRTTAYIGYSNADRTTDSADTKITAAGLVHRF